MVLPDESAPPPIDAEESGILLGGLSGVTASDLYDPANGKVLLVPGAPIDRPPPSPGQIRMGLIDSGVLPDHPQLRNLIVAMKDFAGEDPIDRVGHGTVVAIQLAIPVGGEPQGSVAADSPSTSKLSRSPAIVSAKVTSPSGTIDVENVIEAIHWMAAQGVKVVNLSLAFLGRKERYSKLCDAITGYATEPNGGIMFVAAAGNFGPNVVVYPAACGAPNLISVGAVVDGRLWEHSGKGEIAAEGTVLLLPAHAYHYQAAERLARVGAYAEARNEYAASLASELNAPALFGVALLDLNDGHLDAAYTALMQAKELAPNNAEIEAHLGAVRLLQKDPAEARTHLDRAIELDPKNVRALTNRAIALSRLAEPAKALNDLVEARSLTTDTSRIDNLISNLLTGSRVL